MRGLTPEEYGALREIESEIRYPLEDGTIAREVRESMVLQGRVCIGAPAGATPDAPYSFYLTPSGREALRLYPLMLALQAHL